MRYIDMVRNAPRKSEEVMWESVEAVSELIDAIYATHPDKARDFMMKERARLYGPHFDEQFAKDIVEEMYHYDSQNRSVAGEIVTVNDAKSLLTGIDDADDKIWDAYVGANGFLHDLARSGMNTRQILELARCFWFHDDDFDDESKVYWYYSNK